MARSPAEQWREAIRATVVDLFPELGRGLHLPIRARVKKVKAVQAGKSNRQGYRYSVTVRPLNRDGSEAKPDIPDVPIPKLWGGPGGRGVFALPAEGSTVALVFDYGDPALPRIVDILPEGQDVPAAALDELLIQQGASTWISIKPDGTIVIEAPNILVGDGSTEPIPLGQALLDWLNNHVHLGNLGGPTSTATQPGLAIQLLSQQHTIK